MNKKPKNIEQLYSESFNDFRLEPSSGLWKKISSKLAWRNFFSFNPSTLNAYYVAGILTLSVAGALWITKSVSDNNQDINEITINKTIETPTITTVQENEPESKEVTTQEESRKLEDGNKIKDKSKKIKVKKEEQESNKDINSALSSGVLTKADSSAIVTTKAETNESISSIKHVSPSTKNPVPSTREPGTRNTESITPTALFELYSENPNLPTDPVFFLNLSKNSVRYEWHFGDSETSYEFEPTHFYQNAGNYNIKLKVWSEDGSVDSLVICYKFANSAYKIEFPNAFTPNSNGPTNGYYTPGLPNNDVFHPEYKGVVEYHLRIFNRRGELIFECKDINIGWDGYIHSRLATQGVYVWKARGKYSNGQNFIKAGNVMLIIK